MLQVEYKNIQYNLGAFGILLTGPAGFVFPDQSCTYLNKDIGEFKYNKNNVTLGGVSESGIQTGVLMKCQFELATEWNATHFAILLDDLADFNEVPLSDKLSAATDFAIKDITSVKLPPTISGTPPAKATPGVAYSFIPTANDADGDPLSFVIKNAPPWANFNTTTGALTGTPVAKDYGIYGAIVISVTAGGDTVALPAFEIFVEDISNPIAVDIPDGTFASAQTVTLTCQDDGSGCTALYYTLDGSTPTTGSTRYTAPVTVSATASLKYIAVDISGRISDVRTKNFIINKTITPPTVKITYPTDQSAFNPFFPLTGITGMTSDSGSVGIAKVELQITDGVNYMVERNKILQWMPTTPSWLTSVYTENTWKNWDLGTNQISWTSGQTYTITARVTDKSGNTAQDISTFLYTDKILLAGTILDSNKQPMAGVSVTLESDDTTSPKIVVSTDKFGKYLWEVSKSGWSGTITPKKPGYEFKDLSRRIEAIKTNQLNHDFTATALVLEDALAIIVAGGDVKDRLWTATKYVADLAYDTLLKKGVSEKNIRYLSVYDKKDSKIHAPSSIAAMKDAITNWAVNQVSATKPLIIYMVDHGDDDAQFYATKPPGSDPDIITGVMLKEWLDSLQTKTGAKVILIIDTCYSGSFLQPLKPSAGITNRIVLASTGANEKAYFSYDGSLSFSSYFWNSIKQSNSLQESFNSSKDAIEQSSTPVTPQHARLDADSDGLYKQDHDSTLVRTTYLGNPLLMASRVAGSCQSNRYQ
ncbi:MAG: chitobiase/beta-hexosaminidase C-terminal domain-containing protein [Magnetococcus sp. YQC-5]